MTTIDRRHNPTPSPPGWVFLVRHGRTSLNAHGRLRGWLDPPLTPVAEGPLPWQAQ